MTTVAMEGVLKLLCLASKLIKMMRGSRENSTCIFVLL